MAQPTVYVFVLVIATSLVHSTARKLFICAWFQFNSGKNLSPLTDSHVVLHRGLQANLSSAII